MSPSYLMASLGAQPPDLAARLGRLPIQSLGMTSNGISLKRKLPALVAAGLSHLNISLDTLDPMKYELMTRRRGFSAVMEALEVARGLKKEGLTTKLNVVVIRGGCSSSTSLRLRLILLAPRLERHGSSRFR